MLKIGQGFDVHRFGPGDHIMLGGVRLPHSAGLVAHSDGDVLLHALCDALLGAIGAGDIGQHFPDSEAEWSGADSAALTEHVWSLVRAQGLQLGNADLTVIGERPRVGPHREAIRARVAGLLQARPEQINIKATTTEAMGFTGRREGLAAMAVVLLQPPGGPSAAAG